MLPVYDDFGVAAIQVPPVYLPTLNASPVVILLHMRFPGRISPRYGTFRLAHAMPVAMLIALLYSSGAFAQQPDGQSLADRVAHETWSRGLPGNVVKRIIQTHDGYLRIATDGGLASFDGIRFVARQSPPVASPDSFPDNYVNDVIEARSGDLWLATQHAGVVWQHGQRFRSYAKDAGLPDNEANVVYEDRRGTIWAGSREGAARLVGDRFERVPDIPRANVYSIAEDPAGDVWFGTEDGLLISRGGTTAVRVPLTPFRAVRVLRVLKARDGSMWAGTEQGLAHLVANANGTYHVARAFTLADGLRSSYVTSVAQQSDGTIWVGTLGGGIARLDADGRFRSLGAGEGLADNNAFAICVDRDGSVWAGTVDGLTRIRPQTLSTFRAQGAWTTSLAWSATALKDGSAWIGTGSDGVVRVARDGSTRAYTTAHGLPSDVVYTTYQRADGSIWVGTKMGVAQLVGERFVDRTAALGLPPGEVRTITEDSRGRFWVGETGRLTAISAAASTSMAVRPGLLNGRIYSVAEDQSHRIWVANGLLYLIERDSLVPFAAARNDSLTQVMDVHPDTAGVWVGDYVGGLSLVQGTVLRRFPPGRTGIFAQVLQIVDDGRGSLWLTSGTGLQRVRKADLMAFVADTARPIPSRIFTRADGMRSHDFGKAGNTSGTRGPDGRLWLPTTAGLLVVDPTKIPTGGTPPSVYIERVMVNDQFAPAAGTVAVRDARTVRIEFTTPVLDTPTQTHMWYRLIGVDADWRLADATDRSASYQNLPRGHFRFQVRAATADGVPSVRPTEIELVSTPPLTRSAWFWALMVVIGVSIGAIFANQRVRRLRAHGALLQRLVDERTEALAARELAEGQLQQVQKMEPVGRLAGGVAHDFNNMLGVILGNTDMALRSIAPDDPIAEDLREIQQAAMRSVDLTRQLLTFARRQMIAPSVLDLNGAVTNALRMLERMIGEDITITVQTQASLWPVFVDPTQLDQVLINLCVNARDAIAGVGAISLSLGNVEVGAGHEAVRDGARPGEYVCLTITDDGAGMSRETRDHIFEPFFTTKGVGEGTGLGLSTVYGAVQQSGGAITVESAPGKGATFRIYLPRHAAAACEVEVAVPTASPGGSETILLVEDETSLLRMTAKLLESLGYVVLAANSPAEALRLAVAYPASIDLLLTDIVMPGMNGRDLATSLRAIYPSVPTLYISGYSAGVIESRGALEPGVQFLAKPFTRESLAAKIREVMEGTTRTY